MGTTLYNKMETTYTRRLQKKTSYALLFGDNDLRYKIDMLSTVYENSVNTDKWNAIIEDYKKKYSELVWETITNLEEIYSPQNSVQNSPPQKHLNSKNWRKKYVTRDLTNIPVKKSVNPRIEFDDVFNELLFIEDVNKKRKTFALLLPRIESQTAKLMVSCLRNNMWLNYLIGKQLGIEKHLEFESQLRKWKYTKPFSNNWTILYCILRNGLKIEEAMFLCEQFGVGYIMAEIKPFESELNNPHGPYSDY